MLGYYHAQLNDMIQYPDLRTEVFQSFREIGNAIIFCMLVEQSLVSLFQTLSITMIFLKGNQFFGTVLSDDSLYAHCI